MSKAVECLSANIARAKAAREEAQQDLDAATSLASAAQARIAQADETIRDISAALSTLAGG